MTNTPRLRIASTGLYLPERVVTNEEFDDGRLFYKYDCEGRRVNDGEPVTVEYIRKLSGGEEVPERGILERRYAAPGETSSSMGTLAAIQAIDRADIDPRTLAGIILGTVSEKENFPSGACKIQENLERHYNIRRMNHCESFDVAAACAGGVYALRLAQALNSIRQGIYLALGVEDVAGMWEDDDRDKFLFGAAGAAALLVPSTDERGIIATYAGSATHGGRTKWINRDSRGFGRMAEGSRVLRRGTRAMIEAAKEVKQLAGWKSADIYDPHQANGRMLDGVEAAVTPEGAIVVRNIHRTGNTSAATCLSALDDVANGKIVQDGKKVTLEGKKVILTSVGAGLFFASAAIQS